MRRLATVTSIEEGHTCERHGIADADRQQPKSAPPGSAGRQGKWPVGVDLDLPTLT
ncbi:hypothetical protein [Mesorhizobium sp.]|uniref:hypothetical protein n=1 Tax=Mesorhizobium sp. TaxID=1871066 RepID=UPI0025BD57CF|nr:hypothetical protein [Mesorhizobium sp.]